MRLALLGSIMTGAVSAHPWANTTAAIEYTTEIVTELTTYCPAPTTLTHGTNTYTVTEATTLTITDCPCTVTKPVTSAPMTTPEVIYTTEVVTELTTYCPVPTTLTHGNMTYTVTEPTTLTITDCPCTVTKPMTTPRLFTLRRSLLSLPPTARLLLLLLTAPTPTLSRSPPLSPSPTVLVPSASPCRLLRTPCLLALPTAPPSALPSTMTAARSLRPIWPTVPHSTLLALAILLSSMAL